MTKENMWNFPNPTYQPDRTKWKERGVTDFVVPFSDGSDRAARGNIERDDTLVELRDQNKLMLGDFVGLFYNPFKAITTAMAAGISQQAYKAKAGSDDRNTTMKVFISNVGVRGNVVDEFELDVEAFKFVPREGFLVKKRKYMRGAKDISKQPTGTVEGANVKSFRGLSELSLEDTLRISESIEEAQRSRATKAPDRSSKKKETQERLGTGEAESVFQILKVRRELVPPPQKSLQPFSMRDNSSYNPQTAVTVARYYVDSTTGLMDRDRTDRELEVFEFKCVKGEAAIQGRHKFKRDRRKQGKPVFEAPKNAGDYKTSVAPGDRVKLEFGSSVKAPSVKYKSLLHNVSWLDDPQTKMTLGHASDAGGWVKSAHELSFLDEFKYLGCFTRSKAFAVDAPGGIQQTRTTFDASGWGGHEDSSPGANPKVPGSPDLKKCKSAVGAWVMLQLVNKDGDPQFWPNTTNPETWRGKPVLAFLKNPSRGGVPEKDLRELQEALRNQPRPLRFRHDDAAGLGKGAIEANKYTYHVSYASDESKSDSEEDIVEEGMPLLTKKAEWTAERMGPPNKNPFVLVESFYQLDAGRAEMGQAMYMQKKVEGADSGPAASAAAAAAAAEGPRIQYKGMAFKVQWIGPPSKETNPVYIRSVQTNRDGEVEPGLTVVLTDGSKFKNPKRPDRQWILRRQGGGFVPRVDFETPTADAKWKL